jgi:hypothetical protein
MSFSEAWEKLLCDIITTQIPLSANMNETRTGQSFSDSGGVGKKKAGMSAGGAMAGWNVEARALRPRVIANTS